MGNLKMFSCAIENNVLKCVVPTWDATLSQPILDATPG